MPRKAPSIGPLPPDAPFYQRSHDGRTSAYTPELGAWIAGRIADGVSLTGLCRHPDLPSIKTIYNWRDRHPDFAEMLAKEQIDIARRTVAKYRELMGILPSSKRKQVC